MEVSKNSVSPLKPEPLLEPLLIKSVRVFPPSRCSRTRCATPELILSDQGNKSLINTRVVDHPGATHGEIGKTFNGDSKGTRARSKTI